MSWINMIMAAPVRFIKRMLWREPVLTFQDLEQNQCDEIQVKRMLQSSRAQCDACLDSYTYAVLQEQVDDLEQRHKCIMADRKRLNNVAVQQGLIIDRTPNTAC